MLNNNSKMLTGKQVLAISMALEAFKKSEKRSDVNNYRVIVDETSNTIEVAFVPNDPEIGGQHDDMETYVTRRGGVTVFGRELNYIISKDKMEIIKRHYGR